jgi:hypothetical protein
MEGRVKRFGHLRPYLLGWRIRASSIVAIEDPAGSRLRIRMHAARIRYQGRLIQCDKRIAFLAADILNKLYATGRKGPIAAVETAPDAHSPKRQHK